MLYDGNPGTPDLGVLWDLAEAGRRHVLRHERGLHRELPEGRHPRPREGRDLSRLRSVGSTGSPLSPEGFAWVYESIHEDIWLFSTSGGTDVGTAFVGGVPTLPVYQGELQARSLGVKLESWSPEGKPLIGEVGELVITEPMPSMPIYFWGDPDGSRYRESYFEMFPGIWRHGDWIEITDRGTAIISGRSDATINRGGVRMGTSEIYRAVLTLDEVVDALVLDLPLPGTEGFMPLFVVLRDGATLDDDLVARIRRADPRGLLAPPRPRPRRADRRGTPHALRQGARAPRQADPPRRRRPTRPSAATPSPPPPRSTRSRRWPGGRPTRGPKLVFANIVGYPTRRAGTMKARILAEENRKWWTLAAVSFALFMIMLDNTVVNVALPAIQRDLGIGVSQLEWVVTGYALSFAVLMLTGGKLADMLGRRRIFLSASPSSRSPRSSAASPGAPSC